MDALRDMADVVVVDTPACAAVADALLISHYADCIVQVVGLGKVNEETMLDTTVALQAAGPSTLTYFVNRTPRQSDRSHSQYYYAMKRGSVREPAGRSADRRVELLIEKENDDEAD